MDKKWIYIGLGTVLAITVGSLLVRRYRLRHGNDKGGGNNNGNNDQQPTITPAQAIAIADGVHQAIEDCAYDSLGDTKAALAPIKNQADFDLVKAAFGTRDIDACTWSTQSDTKTDLVSGLYWEYTDSEEINNLKSFLNSKGVAI
jgi:hypothetical protein